MVMHSNDVDGCDRPLQEHEGTVAELQQARFAGHYRMCQIHDFNAVMVACGHVLCLA